MNENVDTCPDKESLVAFLYDEDPGGEHPVIEAHLDRCVACRDEVTALRRVRGRLTEWEVPVTDAPVPLFEGPPVAAEPRPWITRPGFMAAAAAVLILGMAAGLANLEVRVDRGGLVIRTGWSRPAAAPGQAPATAPAGLAPAASLPVIPAGAEPWRTDLAALERQLRQEFRAARAEAATPVAAPAPARGDAQGLDPDVLRRVQALVDESEVRQQRNLALRIAEVSRDFDLQRRTDLVQIQQGLGRLEGRTDAEAARTRELVNYMMRVSQQQPPR
jgi:hypothetical protein